MLPPTKMSHNPPGDRGLTVQALSLIIESMRGRDWAPFTLDRVKGRQGHGAYRSGMAQSFPENGTSWQWIASADTTVCEGPGSLDLGTCPGLSRYSTWPGTFR